MPLVEFDKVTKIYGKTNRGPALRDISLAVSQGESLGIVGESGAGKTTLAAIATGQTFPTMGRILIGGKERRDGAAGRRRLARKLQLVWQDAAGSLDPRLTVEDTLAEPLTVHGLYRENRDTRIRELLGEVGLPAELARRLPHELSGGETQRVVIARALSLDPELLICDEPASALDALTKLKIADLLKSLQEKRRMALIVIAHDLGLARRMVSELAVMYRGAIVERGPAALVSAEPLHPYSRRLFASDPALTFKAGGFAADLAASGITTVTPADSRGCVFLQSCEAPSALCSQEHPGLIRLANGRSVACVEAAD